MRRPNRLPLLATSTRPSSLGRSVAGLLACLGLIATGCEAAKSDKVSVAGGADTQGSTDSTDGATDGTADGTDGATDASADATDATDAIPGTDATDGSTGTDAEQPTDGTVGTDGTDPTDGTVGTDGTDVIGTDGTDGVGTACGGFGGATCSDTEYCDYTIEAMCGAADAQGTCTPKPEVCGKNAQPTCACDGKIYDNPCMANQAGVSAAPGSFCESLLSCGGIAGLPCAKGEYCHFAEVAQCGAADQMGTCEVIPTICTEEYAPVCGCDDLTYSNACSAAAAGVSVAQSGACAAAGKSCGGKLSGPCGKGEYCAWTEWASCGMFDAPGVCKPIPDACDMVLAPVCGCDGQIYDNECVAASAGISIAPAEHCQTQTACGGFAGALCGVGEFCNFPIEAQCGAADQMGFCEPMPTVCTKEYIPVCGCDGVTYDNACFAATAGISVAADGECGGSFGTVCGGKLGSLCAKGEYCHFALEAGCGYADQTGTCELMPDLCTKEFMPVCGCDGQTYSNECMAAVAGVSVLSYGACTPPTGTMCGGFAGFMCPKGQYCSYTLDAMCGAADQSGTCESMPQVCPMVYIPVCGCDGSTYGNACEAASAGVSVASDGPCT